MTVQKERNQLFLKSVSITFCIILVCVIAVYFMGHAYSATEKVAFGREVRALAVIDSEHISFFGKEIYFPIIKAVDYIDMFKKYATSGATKLLALSVNGVKELVKSIIQLI